MIKIILILLLLHYIGLYFFKPKHNVLCCGLFGWSGSNVNKFNKDKFDKLGILNVERGKSSCGVAFDGDIQIGIDNEKYYYDFIINRDIKPLRFPVVIGHTRQSSVGSVNIFNAHPFGFGDHEGDYIFIGAHNGTLKNHKELAQKYNVEENIESFYYDKYDKEVNISRTKIDSEILLEIIYKNKNFKVLSEYVGGAALVFTDTTKPNVLYLFKGKSKDYTYSNHETTERPLFVYVENKNSMYFSSLEDSLKTIGGRDNNIIDIDSNIIYKITNGDFHNAEKIIISRKNATQNISHTTTKAYGPQYGYFNDLYNDGYNNFSNLKKEKKEEVITSMIALPSTNVVKEIEKNLNIYKEVPLKNINDYRGRPYFNKLRWWRNGQLITGIYVWINNYGYFLVGNTLKEANENFYFIVDKVFDGKAFVTNENIKGKIPFQSFKNIEPSFFYFVEGVQLKTLLDYAHFYDRHRVLSSGKYLDYIQLSQVSTHPIINMNFQIKDVNNQNILKNGIIVQEDTYSILGAEEIYTIEKGNLISMKPSLYFSNIDLDYYKIEEKTKEIVDLVKLDNGVIKLDNETLINNAFSIIEQDEILEQSDEELLENLLAKEQEENDIIKDLCNEDFTEPIKDFQQIRTKLFNNFSENSLAIKIIHFVDNAMKDINNFIN